VIHSSLDSGVYDLQLGELGKAFLGELDPDAGLLGPAERDMRPEIEMFVDPDGAGFNLACDCVRTLGI
jgi:hypothetical protein